MVIFAGKAAPGYAMAKSIIRLIFCIGRKINNDSSVNNKLRVAFVENYNVSKSEIIIAAADVSEQISTAGMEASGTGNMKLAFNGALSVCTEDGGNVEMGRSITNAWWPFRFGATSEENDRRRMAGSYNPKEIYERNGAIKAAVNMLRDGSLAENDDEYRALSLVGASLLDGIEGNAPDRYFVLGDLESFYETHKKVEDLFCQPMKWAEVALHNIAGMGKFSSDEAIHSYAKLVWDLRICPPDPGELARVRAEYSEHDKCRIR